MGRLRYLTMYRCSERMKSCCGEGENMWIGVVKVDDTLVEVKSGG